MGLPLVLALLLGVVSGPFSHKAATHSKLACVTCHAGAAKDVKAGFPKTSVCAGCHTGLEEGQVKIPSARVYRLADYVIFSHGRHAAAKVECGRCHGQVREQETVRAEVIHNMQSCVGCHKERSASLSCTVCHELGQ